MQRLSHLDALRGLAVVTMVAANMAPYFLAEPHPLWLRVFGTFAAPLFIGLAGYMAAMQAERGRSLREAVARGALLLLIGAGIDVGIWGIWPGVGFDALYLIGVAMVVVPVLWRGGAWGLAGGVVIPIAAGIWLRTNLGYEESLHTFLLDEPLAENSTVMVFQQWFWSGWFPLFPWLAVAVAGAVAYRYRAGLASVASRGGAGSYLAASVAAMVLGWLAIDGESRLTRGGYSELFYPADVGFLAWAAAVCLGLTLILHATREQSWQRPLSRIGQSSLFFYAMHLAMIRLFRPPEPLESLGLYLGWYALLLIVMQLCSWAIGALLERWKTRPVLVKMLIG